MQKLLWQLLSYCFLSMITIVLQLIFFVAMMLKVIVVSKIQNDIWPVQ
jgi:hypothetical protein